MSAASAVTCSRIFSLPGGETILSSRDRAARLLEELPGLERSPGGAADGWGDLSRRGRIEHLLASEHIVDDDEFFRRWAHGEQLHLSRETLSEGVSDAVLHWHLTPAALGTPRLATIGLALALRSRLEESGAAFRLVVNDAADIDIGQMDGLRAALAHPPRVTGDAGELSGSARGFLRGGRDVYLAASEPFASGTRARREEPPAAAFLIEERSLTLLLPGPRGDFEAVRTVSLGAPRRGPP